MFAEILNSALILLGDDFGDRFDVIFSRLGCMIVTSSLVPGSDGLGRGQIVFPVNGTGKSGLALRRASRLDKNCSIRYKSKCSQGYSFVNQLPDSHENQQILSP